MTGLNLSNGGNALVKKGFIALIIMALMLPVLGCAGKKVPPPGQEDSILWKHGFLPYGPVIVKAAFRGIMEIVPELRGPILVVGREAKAALEAGGLREGVNYLVLIFVANQSNPVVRAIAANAVDVLITLSNVPERLLTPADKAVLISMIDEIISYASLK